MVISKPVQETIPVQLGLDLPNLLLVFHFGRVPAFIIALISRSINFTGSDDPQSGSILFGFGSSVLSSHPLSITPLEISQVKIASLPSHPEIILSRCKGLLQFFGLSLLPFAPVIDHQSPSASLPTGIK